MTGALPVARWTTAVLGAALVTAGCGQHTATSPTASVSGQVSYQGRPLSQGTVVFVHASGRSASGHIRPDGGYQVDALQGPNQIAVICRSPDVPNPSGRPQTIPGKSHIPAHYADHKTSKLQIEVKAGDNKEDLRL